VLTHWIQQIKTNWSEAAASERGFGLKFAVNAVGCFIVYMILTRILIGNCYSSGAQIHDPFFSFFKPINFSVPIFFCTYAGIFTFLYYVIPQPKFFYFALRAFVLVFAFRLGFILLIPLQPSPDMIDLKDPFTDNVIGFHGQVCNDLFFSGHVADLAFFAISCFNTRLRRFLIFLTISAAVMLVWQKVHYTADVLAAPVFSFFVYTIVLKKYAALYVPETEAAQRATNTATKQTA
jgi:hypothetical protein